MSIQCPKCGKANSFGMTTCGNCSASLIRICPGCGFELPIHFKFCGNCGIKLNGVPEVAPNAEAHHPLAIPDTLAQKISSVGKQIEGERRNVTILFSDISGYTAIAEKLDPEQVYELIDQTLKDFTAEIYKHEGTIDKVMGDGVMALFGAPIAHEDDPARAVRAALGMQDALKRINSELEPRLGITLRVRIGLHTGTVVVGSIGSDLRMEYTALGDTVNVASRLQNLAEPGSVLVSRSVYEATKPLYEFRELGSIRVKNRVEPVEIFEALAPRQIAGRVRGIPGLTAPMIGRAEEYAQVRLAVDELTHNRRGRLLLVTGNAGIGKSRLTSEIKSYLTNKWIAALEGACLSYGQPAYGIFLQILRGLFQLADNDSEEITREKIERSISSLLPADETVKVLPYIENLFSIRIFDKELVARIRHLSPPQLQQQTFIAIRELLTAQAQEKPLLLIFEDIHWIDSVSLEMLKFLIDSVENTPLLIYCNSRPTEGVAAPQLEKLGKERYFANFISIALSPLSQADSVTLIDLLLTIHELPDTLKQIIPQRAEGNPFYLEEIIRMFIDRGIIRRHEDRWQVTPNANLDDLQVPTTLQGLIMTRVDHLSENARQALQYATVIGRDFTQRLLNNVIENTRSLNDDLQELQERQLIARIGDTDYAEYRFTNIVIQETVYNSLLVRRREYLHQKIAVAIESLFKDRLDEHIEELAFHYAEGKDLDRALPYLIRAGRHASDQFANEQALKHYRLAVDFLTKTNPTAQQRIDIYTGLGSVQTFTGDYSGATTSYLIALEIVRSVGKSGETARKNAEIMRAIGRVCERRGDYTEALRWLDNSLKELEQDPDPKSAERVRIYNDYGWVQYRRGEFDQAYDWAMRTLQIVEGTEYYSEMASVYNRLVAQFNRKGDWARATAYAEKGLHLRERIGDQQGLSNSYNNMAVIEWEQGQWDQALQHLKRSLDIRQKIGDIEGIASNNTNLCELYTELGDFAQATEYGDRALAIGEKIRHGNLTCLALINLAYVKILQNQFESAIVDLTRSITIATEMGSKERIAEAKWHLAEAYLGLGQMDTAQTYAEQAIALATSIGRKMIESKVLRTQASIAQQQHDLPRAFECIEKSLAILTALKSQFEIARSQYQLAVIQQDQGKPDLARTTLEQALVTFDRLGARVEQQRARAQLESLKPPTRMLE